MYITICEIDNQSKFNAWNRALKVGALGQLKGMGWGGRWERGSGWGTHIYLWLIHVNVWQKPPQYIKKKKKKTESWVLKNWSFQAVVLEKTLESSLDCKEIKPVNSKRNQSSIFIGRTDAEGEILILWPPDAKNWFIGKDVDAGQDWR